MQKRTSESEHNLSEQNRVISLKHEHRQIDERVCELDQRIHLSVAEYYERRRLQKRKLAIKDELVQLRLKASNTVMST